MFITKLKSRNLLISSITIGVMISQILLTSIATVSCFSLADSIESDEVNLISTEASKSLNDFDNILPVIEGVEDGFDYNVDKKITFEGTATLDGQSFNSGSVVNTEGSHKLIVKDNKGKERIINFIIDKTPPIVSGVSDGQVCNEEVKISIEGAVNAYLNGQMINPYGETVRDEGEYVLSALDITGNKTNLNFRIVKSQVILPQISYKRLNIEDDKIDEGIARAIESSVDPISGIFVEPFVKIDLTQNPDKNIQIFLSGEKLKKINNNSLGLSLDTNDVKIDIDTSVLKNDVAKMNPKEVILSKATIEEDDAKSLNKKIIQGNPEGVQITNVRDFNLEIKDQSEKISKISSFSEKIKVELKLSPQENQKIKDPNKAAVYNLLPDGSYEYVGGVYNKATGTMEFETNHFSFYVVMENNKTFNDISESFAGEQIEILASRNILKGTDSKNYDPKGTVTRGQFAIMISKVLGLRPETYSAVFRDVGEKDYYTGYVLSAYKYNIIKGDGAAFRPNEIITREQIATIMISAMKNIDRSLVKEYSNNNLAFWDKSNISTYALASISEANRLGIMKGFPDNSFLPKKPLSREEAAAVIINLMKTAKIM